MANNYLQFSEVIPHITPDEEAWLRRAFAAGERAVDALEPEEDDAPAPPGLEDFLSSRADEGDLGFCWDFGDDDVSGHHLWFYTEESGTPQAVADLVQAFFKTCRPTGFFSLTWAGTCSRPRIGEFGGGALVVTADTQEWLSTYQWVEERRKAHGG